MARKQKSQAEQTGADLLVQCLEAQGVDTIFTIPGGKIDRVLDRLNDSSIRMVVCRHEQNAAFMAQASGRITGKPGVCLVTSGPGCTNLATGLATADYEGDPVVAIGGSVPLTDRLKLAHQSLDTISLFRPITRYAAEITTGRAIPEVVASAFRAAEAGRQGASFISIPHDVMDHPAEGTAAPAMPIRLSAANPDAIELAAGMFRDAKMPVLLAGMSASMPEAASAIQAFLRCFPMAVVATYQGAGVIPVDLLHCFGGRVGVSPNQPGDRLLQESDLVITVGFDPIEYDPSAWNGNPERPIIHIDTTPADYDTHYWPAVELTGDISASISLLVTLLPEQTRMKDHPLLKAVTKELELIRREGARKKGKPVHPLRLIHDLREFLDANATVICDVGSVYMWMSRYFLCHHPRHFLTSNGQQTLGVALPWAIAATMVRPESQVFSVSGDGGFLFSAAELETAVRIQAHFVHMVWTDGTYNMVKIQQEPKFGRSTAVDLGPVDIVKYAEAFGATGFRIHSPEEIIPTLAKAYATPGPVLIDVPVDYRDNHKLFESMDNRLIH